jgi:hypothetical protein
MKAIDNIVAGYRYWAIYLLLGMTAACSDDLTVTDDTLPVAAVTFRVQGALPATRAAATGVEQVNAVIVNGRITSGTRADILLDGSTLFRIKGTENHFDYSPHAYFPSWADQALFAAYSPAGSHIGKHDFTVSPMGDDADNIIRYQTVSPTEGTQEDLLVAVATVDKLFFAAPVVMNMHHALSRVHIRARNQMIYPVIIEKLSLHNLYTEGWLDVDGTAWGVSTEVDITEGYVASANVTEHSHYKVLWQPAGAPDGTLEWKLPETGAVMPASQKTERVTTDDQAMMVIPQTTRNTLNAYVPDPDSGDFYLEITYTIQNYGSNTVKCAFRDVNGLTPTIAGEGLTFEMGRQYALTVIFTAEAVVFDVSVDAEPDPAP